MYKDHLRGHTASVPKLISPDCNCKIDLSDLQKRKEHMISIHGIDISTNPNVECDCKMTFSHVQVRGAHLNKDRIETNSSVPWIQGRHENALIKSFKTSPHMICL